LTVWIRGDGEIVRQRMIASLFRALNAAALISSFCTRRDRTGQVDACGRVYLIQEFANGGMTCTRLT